MVEISPQDVQQKQFDTAKRGFDPQQVGAFLDQVAATLAQRDRALHEAHAEIASLSNVDVEAGHNQEAFRLTLKVATETMDEMLRMAGERAAAIEEEAKSAAEFMVERARADAGDKVASVRRELKALETERVRLESQIAQLDESATTESGEPAQDAQTRRPLELVVDHLEVAEDADAADLAARVGDVRG